MKISEVPPVSVLPAKRDWADWSYLGFNFLLVVVGSLQVWLLLRTWKTIDRQADIQEAGMT